MPIYAYKCSNCGFEKDALQKMSDAPLTDCPSCGEPALKKQVTAAGFQLKGSGWYVTDFRNGNNAGNKPATGVAPATGGDGASAKTDTAAPAASDSKTSSSDSSGGSSTSAAAAPAAVPAKPAAS
ncbi:FmdB family zinc ribbon protein [Pigmentiphaga litoralis]|uniref:Putative FmdB family regulatory protein n=1 Tax=Pigmentiphaga litoralis TaxID=516702 RepID=A0A7Y9IS51_9BURK|nr:FmdB family zinc ribbon protein [Pigmentiphaga litoralis]NYE24325.1 putative FmdB family regulatory protein [Pigmentiphaga litoralis]NYE82061.1 putative FmdB family regulatory protein [Pigmentiphaga litoralis]